MQTPPSLSFGRNRKLQVAWHRTINKGPVEYFHVTGTLTSAAAGTAVVLITDAQVGSGRKVYVRNFRAKVDGGTNWATTATVKIQDTNGTPVDFVTMAVAALTGNAFVGPHTANITAEAAFAKNSGGTAGKGLQIKGDANGTGSNLVVTVDAIVG